MLDFPEYDALAHVSRSTICGLLDELGTPAWNAPYEYAWERDRRTWEAVAKALQRSRRRLRRTMPRETPPRWLAPLVRGRLRKLSTNALFYDGFASVRLLERLGFVDLDVDDTYVLAFISGFVPMNGRRDSVAPALRRDPELVDRVLWRLFEVEGGGEVSLTNVDRFGGCWQQTFLDLIGDGTIPRDRVMSRCLDTLAGDFSTYRASWFSKLYMALDPTLDEMSRHQEAYRLLLRSEVGPTVSLAMKQLGALLRSGRLDATETIPALTPVVLGRAKGSAVAALKMAERLAADDPGLQHQATALAREAVGHPNRDVQAAAVRVLERYGAGAAAVARADELAPSLQRALGITAEERLDTGPPPVAFRASAPMLPSSRDDLLERTAALLEDASNVLEVEAVLAGLASTGPTDALRPLLKRARRPGGGPMSTLVAWLVRASLGDPVQPTPALPGPVAFLVSRFAEVADVLAGKERPRTLLATPDTGEGWVTPTTLVDRLLADPDPLTSDLVAALLRLGPEGRAEALGRARQVPGEVGRVLCHALGGEVDAAGVIRVPWWVASSHARAPLDEDPLLLAHGLDVAGQGRPLTTGLEFTTTSGTYVEGGHNRTWTHYYWTSTVEQALPGAGHDQPTAHWPEAGPVSKHDVGLSVLAVADTDLGELVAHLAAIWPHDAEHFLAHTCPVVFYATYPGPWHDAVRVLEALSHHPGRLGNLAAATIAVGLSAGRPDQRLAAIDAFHDLVGTGRVAPTGLADAMELTAGHCTATRWGASLRDASATPMGARAAVATLTSLLPRLQAGHPGLHALLDVLHEESLRHGLPVTDASLRAWLQGFSGSSKAARTARALLTV